MIPLSHALTHSKLRRAIKVLKRLSYGYRDFEYFALKIKSSIGGYFNVMLRCLRRTLKSSKAPTNYFTPNILRKSWSRLVVSVVHLDALAFPVAAT